MRILIVQLIAINRASITSSLQTSAKTVVVRASKKSLVAVAGRRSGRTLVNEREKVEGIEVVEKEEEYDANGARGRCGNGEKGRDDVRACRSRSVPASLVDSLRSLPLLSQVKVRPHLSLSLSFSVSQSLSFSFSFSFSRSLFLAFFLSFWGRAVREEKGIFLFIKLQPLTWSTPTHDPPAAGWVLQQVSDYRERSPRP